MVTSAPPAALFGPRVDGAVFLGAALVSVGLVVLARAAGAGPTTPVWVWLLVVVAIDVAHVWSTIFRVYLDGAELRRKPLLYGGAPLAAWLGGVGLYAVSAGTFWRVLAYVAVWHFVRQQVGWIRLYGRRGRDSAAVMRLDEAAVYAATLGPMVWWHANLPRPYAWFLDGDFVGGLPRWVGDVALVLHAIVLGAWIVSAWRRFHAGKAGLLLATWIAWFGGIVLAGDDLVFTVTNVVLHGVPYFVLVYAYARGRAAEGGYAPPVRWILRGGALGFVGLASALALGEELLWDWLVWHEHPGVFGGWSFDLAPWALTLVVPLLTVPQATHYVLDAFVWRTREDPRLAGRLGWR